MRFLAVVAVAVIPFSAWAVSTLPLGGSEPDNSACGEDNDLPDELEEQLEDLAEELSDPDRGDRTIEDQGEEGRIVGEDERDESTADRAE